MWCYDVCKHSSCCVELVFIDYLPKRCKMVLIVCILGLMFIKEVDLPKGWMLRICQFDVDFFLIGWMWRLLEEDVEVIPFGWKGRTVNGGWMLMIKYLCVDNLSNGWMGSVLEEGVKVISSGWKGSTANVGGEICFRFVVVLPEGWKARMICLMYDMVKMD